LVQSSSDGLLTGSHFGGQISPADAGLEHEHQASEDLPVAHRRTTAFGRLRVNWKQVFDLLPQLIRYQATTHRPALHKQNGLNQKPLLCKLAENEILRSNLPKRIALDNRERNTLVKHGKKLGGNIKDVMTIVSYSTFRRWVRKMEDDTPAPAKRSAKRGSGRPKIEEDVRDTIIRIRKETGFGYTKILQELRRMGVHVSRQTAKNVIVAAGLEPTPGDHPDTWHKFIRRHADTLWKCDFACKKKWTLKGPVDVYFLVSFTSGLAESTSSRGAGHSNNQARDPQRLCGRDQRPA
jgi:transposase